MTRNRILHTMLLSNERGFVMKTMNQRVGSAGTKLLTTSSMVKIGVLSGAAFLLMYFSVPLPLFPNFLKFDLGDVPAILGTFALGPLAGFLIELIKNCLILFLKGSVTGWIGEGANLLMGAAYVVPLGIVLKAYKKKGRAVVASVVAVMVMVLVGAISNYTFLLDAFAKFYGAPIDYFIDMTRAVNPWVVDFKSLILLAIIPFNLLKGTVISLLGCLLYKKLKGYLRLS